MDLTERDPAAPYWSAERFPSGARVRVRLSGECRQSRGCEFGRHSGHLPEEDGAVGTVVPFDPELTADPSHPIFVSFDFGAARTRYGFMAGAVYSPTELELLES